MHLTKILLTTFLVSVINPIGFQPWLFNTLGRTGTLSKDDFHTPKLDGATTVGETLGGQEQLLGSKKEGNERSYPSIINHLYRCLNVLTSDVLLVWEHTTIS